MNGTETVRYRTGFIEQCLEVQKWKVSFYKRSALNVPVRPIGVGVGVGRIWIIRESSVKFGKPNSFRYWLG